MKVLEYIGNKPIVDIADALILESYDGKSERLTGIPKNHPSPNVSNTRTIYTTKIVNKYGDGYNDSEYVETLNTIYRILNWITPKEKPKL